MIRRVARTLWPLLLALLVLTVRGVGCRKRETPKPGAYPAHWITPVMTPPPPRPTVTMWKGVTRVPDLPE